MTSPAPRPGEASPRARPIVERLARDARAGRMPRREFMALASIFGASAATAAALIGAPSPLRARSGEPRRGGTLRIGMQVQEIADPRLFDWPQQADIARTFCEPLVRMHADGTFSGVLLAGWEVADDARRHVLHLREDVRWNNGDPFNADDVIFNIERWCDRSVEGNAMASRMAALIDPETDRARDGAIRKLDSHRVALDPARPDITLIAGMAEFSALIVHPQHAQSGDLAQSPIGTGPFELESHEIGARARLVRRRDGGWWGGEAHLDAVEFIDYGTDPSALVSAFDGGEIDANEETSSEFVELLDGLGLVRASAISAHTMVARMRMDTPPYDDRRVRNAIQLAVDNAVVLELGIDGFGAVAENHHVGPMHPEYAELSPPAHDPAQALALLEEAGHADTEFELISIDDDWRRASADAIAAQLRDAGMKVQRRVLPGATFWNGWTSYPFSVTDWGARPLGVQVLALAYRTGEPWNESAHSDPEFDALLAEANGLFDADARRDVMRRLQGILQSNGVIIQPFWIELASHHHPGVRHWDNLNRIMFLGETWLAA